MSANNVLVQGTALFVSTIPRSAEAPYRAIEAPDSFSVIVYHVVEPFELDVHEICNLACAASPPNDQAEILREVD